MQQGVTQNGLILFYVGSYLILLLNTKGMLALPGRVYDLRGLGLQQEHWSLAPELGCLLVTSMVYSVWRSTVLNHSGI